MDILSAKALRLIIILSVTFFSASTQLFAQSQQLESTSVSFLHLNVSDMDKSLEFYRDILGMEYVNPPTEPMLGKDLGITDDEDAALRTVVLKTVDGGFLLELVEWQNMPVRPMYPMIQDPGEIMLAMTVRDLDTLQAQAEALGLQVLSEHGEPYVGSTNRAVMIQDFDGFIVELVDRTDTEFTAPGQVGNVNVWLSVADLDRTVDFYNHVFGMNMDQPGPASPANDRIQALFGDRSIETMRAARGTFPGSDITINFQEFTGPTRRPVSHRVEDPGGPIYLVGVTDFSMAIEKIQEFGGLIGTDQKSVSLAHDARQSWTRDPNGMLIMLSQGEFTAPE